MSMQDDSPKYECLLRFRECAARRNRICSVTTRRDCLQATDVSMRGANKHEYEGR